VHDFHLQSGQYCSELNQLKLPVFIQGKRVHGKEGLEFSHSPVTDRQPEGLAQVVTISSLQSIWQQAIVFHLKLPRRTIAADISGGRPCNYVSAVICKAPAFNWWKQRQSPKC
jgi:hypothetical protein